MACKFVMYVFNWLYFHQISFKFIVLYLIYKYIKYLFIQFSSKVISIGLVTSCQSHLFWCKCSFSSQWFKVNLRKTLAEYNNFCNKGNIVTPTNFTRVDYVKQNLIFKTQHMWVSLHIYDNINVDARKFLYIFLNKDSS